MEALNKFKISIGAILALIPMLWAAWSYADNYFAHTADVKQIVQQLEDYKKSDLDNKIFELEFKQESTPHGFTPLDKALLERYKRQLHDLKGN